MARWSILHPNGTMMGVFMGLSWSGVVYSTTAGTMMGLIIWDRAGQMAYIGTLLQHLLAPNTLKNIFIILYAA